MEKREFPRKEFFKDIPEKDFGGGGEGGGAFGRKMSHFSSRIFSIIKFFCGVCLLAFVYAFTRAFLSELTLVNRSLQDNFWAGVISFLVFYHFLWEPVIIYRRGQKILEWAFKFFAPLVKTAPYVLPIYTIVICCLYSILSFFVKNEELIHYFMYLFGFSLTLHIIFTAKTLRAKQDFIKANYLFGIAFIFILNIILAAFSLNLIFERFSFVNFFNSAYVIARDIFYAIFKQIFLPS
ncbi:MAG: hypothetical protein PHC33_04210 [Candidatus Omnitrophica bacterium]|nr:hypothetical protein [Candidatus Omnitrophota bacterium]